MQPDHWENPMDLPELKKFSVTQNLYAQVVRPLYESNKVVNLEGLLELLQKVHRSLWQASGYPEGFSGALAGTIQEILDGYKYAVKKGEKVQFGSLSKVGGDTVIVKSSGTVKTTQFKVTASGIDEIKKHISKAAWQLTGAGGETPAKGSIRCVEVIVQDTEAFATWEKEKWASEIAEALDGGYDTQNPAKTGKELWTATDRVIICTKDRRFKFKILEGKMGECVTSPIETKYGYVFAKSRFDKQWLWLTTTWWKENKDKYDIKTTNKFGVGCKKPKTPDSLPIYEG
jgi:hypothetical protein